jgi:hypothetical protein
LAGWRPLSQQEKDAQPSAPSRASPRKHLIPLHLPSSLYQPQLQILQRNLGLPGNHVYFTSADPLPSILSPIGSSSLYLFQPSLAEPTKHTLLRGSSLIHTLIKYTIQDAAGISRCAKSSNLRIGFPLAKSLFNPGLSIPHLSTRPLPPLTRPVPLHTRLLPLPTQCSPPYHHHHPQQDQHPLHQSHLATNFNESRQATRSPQTRSAISTS